MTEEVVEETEAPTQLNAEQKRARRRGLAQQAIALAMQSRWEETLPVNQQILSMFPDDPEASNRIGNALGELSRIQEAIEAYENTLTAQPTNAIAQRNLARLRQVAEAGDLVAKPSQKLPPAFFVEEVGQTGIATLTELAGPETIARVAAGDAVAIRESGGKLEAALPDGTRLGQVEQGLADRLLRLLRTGNTYDAGVVMVELGRLRILVRQTYQSPENEGKISFPPKTATIRAYTRDTLLHRAGDEEDETEADMSDADADDIDDEEENPSEFGFSDSSNSKDVGV